MSLRDRQTHTMLQLVREMKTSIVAGKAGLCASTVRNLRIGPTHGGTRYPRYSTMKKILAVAGAEFAIIDKGSGTRLDQYEQQRPKLRVVGGRQ